MEQDGKSGDKPTFLWSMDLPTKEAKNMQWKIVSSINGAGKNGIATRKWMQLEHSLTPYTKIN